MNKVLFIVFILVLLLVNFLPTIQNTNALQSWTQTTKSDFLTGELNNVSVTDTGEVKLVLQPKYTEDDLKDESKIGYKKNIIIDTAKGEAKLLKINKTFGGSKYDEGRAVQQTSDGGYIIAGVTESYGSGLYDVWLIKTDCFGEELWNRTFGGGNDEHVWEEAVQETNDSGYVIAGDTYSYGAGGSDVWLIKTDSSGNKQWDKTFGGNGEDKAFSIKKTSDGGYVIAGGTTSYGAGNHDVLLIKTDSSGSTTWQKTFGGSEFEWGLSVQQTTLTMYIIAGVTNSYGAGNGDVWLIMTDPSGEEVSNKTFGGSNYDWGRSVEETNDGGYIIAGDTDSYGAGSWDVWVIKTDSSGNKQWDKTFGGSGEEHGWSVKQTSDGGYVITGYTTSYGAGSGDAWLIKINSSGNEEWNRTFGEIGGTNARTVIQTNDDGYVTVGGNRYGAGGGDAWLIKTNNHGKIEFTSGELISKNLLSGENVYSIDAFKYDVYIPSGTSMKVQFSQDNISWYNSAGIMNGWDALANGVNSIELSSLKWNRSNFYYKMNFTSDIDKVPILKYINISYTQYFSSGTIISKTFDAGTNNVGWKTIKWNATVSQHTKIKFQLRSAPTLGLLGEKIFVGPDGTSGSYYTSSSESIWEGHRGDRWLQWKAYLSTTDTSQTPVLSDITLIYNLHPSPPILTSPANNTITNNSKPTFTWNFWDADGDPQVSFLLEITSEQNFSSVDYTSGVVNSPISLWEATEPIKDGRWYWRVKVNDGYDWSEYSVVNVIEIDTAPPYIDVKEPKNGSWTNKKYVNVSGKTEPDVNITVNGKSADVIDDKFNILIELNDGENNIVIVAKDKAGNVNKTTLKVILDTVIPSIEIAEPKDGTITNKNEIYINGTTERDAKIKINDVDVILIDNRFSYRVNLTEGGNSIKISACDKAGNENSLVIYVVLDTKEPSLEIRSLPKFTNQVEIKIEGETDAGAEVFVDGEKIEVINGNFSKTIQLKDGENNITIEARDKAGNIKKIEKKIILDTIPPSLEIIEPKIKKTKLGKIDIKGRTEPGAKVYIDGIEVEVDKNGEFSYTVQLTEGKNIIEIKAVDGVGNEKIEKLIVAKETEGKPIIPAIKIAHDLLFPILVIIIVVCIGLALGIYFYNKKWKKYKPDLTFPPYQPEVVEKPKVVVEEKAPAPVVVIKPHRKPVVIEGRKEKTEFEEAFLIYYNGVLISRVGIKEERIDSLTFAGMLSAVQTFVKDTFSDARGSLNILGYGEKKIVIERGQQMFLAVVIKGDEPETLRRDMRQALIKIWDTHKEVLKRWDGSYDSLVGIDDIIKSHVFKQLKR